MKIIFIICTLIFSAGVSNAATVVYGKVDKISIVSSQYKSIVITLSNKKWNEDSLACQDGFVVRASERDDTKSNILSLARSAYEYMSPIELSVSKNNKSHECEI